MHSFVDKKLLILGATAQTIPFIVKAKEMGVITYVADHIEKSAAKKYADYPLLVNCFDVDELEKIVNENKIDGILLGCADILLPAYQELCERTGKYCYGTKAQIRVFGNKKGLKTMLRKFHMPYIPEYVIERSKEFKDIEFPVFVKPVDNCSSKGMSVCYEEKDFGNALDKALAASRSKTVLVEKYMVCDDISITYTFVNGQIYVTSISDRYVNREQEGVGTITTALVYPSKYTKLYFETLHEKACELFRELEIRDGVLTIQAFVDDGKIMFYDPAFRVTGGQGYIFYDYYGIVDQIKMLIAFALTGDMTTSGTTISNQCNFKENWAVNLVILAKTGVVGNIEGIESVKNMEGVINFTQCHFVGDVITGKGTLDQTIARLHLVADNKKKLAELIEKVLKTIKVYDEKGEDMLLTQFDPLVLLEKY